MKPDSATSLPATTPKDEASNSQRDVAAANYTPIDKLDPAAKESHLSRLHIDPDPDEPLESASEDASRIVPCLGDESSMSGSTRNHEKSARAARKSNPGSKEASRKGVNASGKYAQDQDTSSKHSLGKHSQDNSLLKNSLDGDPRRNTPLDHNFRSNPLDKTAPGGTHLDNNPPPNHSDNNPQANQSEKGPGNHMNKSSPGNHSENNPPGNHSDNNPPGNHSDKGPPGKSAASKSALDNNSTIARDFGGITSSTASHQHVCEQQILSSFSVPKPPISTQESTLDKNHPENLTSFVNLPRTLWMGDIDPWLYEKDIVYIWWIVLKKKVSVKFITPKGNTSSNMVFSAHSGYCFVEFPSYQDAQQALSLNGQLLPDIALPSQQGHAHDPDNQKKYFRLNWAAGATLSAKIVDAPEFSLFVGDLSASTTEAHLLSFFQKSFPDSIRTVRVMADPVTGKSRCFGFVRFTSDAERQRALREMNGLMFGGRPLRVALATPRASAFDRHHPDFRIPFSSPRNGFPPLYGDMAGYYPPPMMTNGPHGMPGQSFGNAPRETPNTTVFVGGLSSDISEKTLYTSFSPFGEILSVKIPPGKGCAFLRFSTPESAQDAIESMKGFIIGGNRIRLGWGRTSAKKKSYMGQQRAAPQMHAGSAMAMGIDPASMFRPNYSALFPPPMPGANLPYSGMLPPSNMMPFLPAISGPNEAEPLNGGQGDEGASYAGPIPAFFSEHPNGSGYPHQVEQELSTALDSVSLSETGEAPNHGADSSQEQFNQGQFNQGQFNRGQFNQGQFNQGQFNQGQFNQSQFNQGQFNQGQFNQGQFNQGQFNQGQYNQDQFYPNQFQVLPQGYFPYGMYPMHSTYGPGGTNAEPETDEH